MTLEELRVWVGNLLQDDDFTRYGGDSTEVNRAINYAIKFTSIHIPYDLLGSLQGKEIEDTVAGTTAYSLPSDFYWFKQASWDNYWCEKIPIEILPIKDKNDFMAPTITSPICYLTYNQINYEPELSESVLDGRVLYYVRVAAALSADTDTNPLNDLLDFAVVLKATAVLASKDQDEDRWLKQFNEEIRRWSGEQGRIQG